jgi:hypothetical protein
VCSTTTSRVWMVTSVRFRFFKLDSRAPGVAVDCTGEAWQSP